MIWCYPNMPDREVRPPADWTRYRDEVMAQGTLQGKAVRVRHLWLFAGGPGTGKTLARTWSRIPWESGCSGWSCPRSFKIHR